MSISVATPTHVPPCPFELDGGNAGWRGIIVCHRAHDWIRSVPVGETGVSRECASTTIMTSTTLIIASAR